MDCVLPCRGLFLLSVLLLVTSCWSIRPAPDLPGSYCGARAPNFQCCEGRSDSCSVPIMGTLCYCDKFCKNTTNEDCCPDYDQVCDGKQLAATQVLSCAFNGQIYEAGQNFRHNCNSCKCTQTGEICCDQTLCVTDAHLLRRLRGMSPILGWYPANYTQFWGLKYVSTLTAIANTKRPDSLGNRDMIRARRHAAYLASHKRKPKGIPETFDARSTWPGAISPIANQGWCNTAWALSTVSTANDRLRIQSEGSNIELSTEELIDCSHSRQSGCFISGQIDRAWNYLRKRGLHSRRHYKRDVEYQCSNATVKYRRYKTGPLYLAVGEENIQQEIMVSGPVQATMRVYRDFFSYEGGIYRSSDSEDVRAGYLAVKIIGWGVHRGIKYWTAANSWGTQWGENGYFRIRRGSNECGIEDFVFAAWGTPLRHSTIKSKREDPTQIDRLQTFKIITGSSGRRKVRM